MTKPQILVVEDDPTLRDLTSRQIRLLGFESVQVCTGEDAVEYPGTGIGLIFMDIGLPGIDGINATLLIREKELKERKKRIPIIALTGHSDGRKVLLAGMDDFLQKPALIADIKGIIDKWLCLRND